MIIYGMSKALYDWWKVDKNGLTNFKFFQSARIEFGPKYVYLKPRFKYEEMILKCPNVEDPEYQYDNHTALDLNLFRKDIFVSKIKKKVWYVDAKLQS
jgi:hypothetical protein